MLFRSGGFVLRHEPVERDGAQRKLDGPPKAQLDGPNILNATAIPPDELDSDKARVAAIAAHRGPVPTLVVVPEGYADPVMEPSEQGRQIAEAGKHLGCQASTGEAKIRLTSEATCSTAISMSVPTRSPR